jgi:DNA mismatch endonuclease (patch repair protein)
MSKQPFRTDAETSQRMSSIRQRSTAPELALRKLLWSEGLRYRCNVRQLPGSPDLANKRERWAIFVHGCFWHGHPNCKRATMPKRNASFWTEKIGSNRARDRSKSAALAALGLDVVTVWECEVEGMTRLGLAAAPPDLLKLLHRLQRQHQPEGQLPVPPPRLPTGTAVGSSRRKS